MEKREDRHLARLEADAEGCISALRSLPDEFYSSDLLGIARIEGWEVRAHLCLTFCVDAQILVRKIDASKKVFYKKTTLFDAPNVKELLVEHTKARLALMKEPGREEDS